MASSTIRFSLYASAYSLSITLSILRSSSIRFFLLCRRPAVSQSSTSAFLAFAAAMESKMTAAGSDPSLCAMISQPVRFAHSVSCSMAAALNVSAAARTTFLFCSFKWPASFPTEVVFPTPLTPISITIDLVFSNSYALGPRFIFSLIVSINNCLQSLGSFILFSLTLALRSSIISSVALTPISPIIRVSSSSS